MVLILSVCTSVCTLILSVCTSVVQPTFVVRLSNLSSSDVVFTRWPPIDDFQPPKVVRQRGDSQPKVVRQRGDSQPKVVWQRGDSQPKVVWQRSDSQQKLQADSAGNSYMTEILVRCQSRCQSRCQLRCQLRCQSRSKHAS